MKRTARFELRLTPAQLRAIERAAIKAHLDLSSFARVALANECRKFGVTLPMPLW